MGTVARLPQPNRGEPLPLLWIRPTAGLPVPKDIPSLLHTASARIRRQVSPTLPRSQNSSHPYVETSRSLWFFCRGVGRSLRGHLSQQIHTMCSRMTRVSLTTLEEMQRMSECSHSLHDAKLFIRDGASGGRDYITIQRLTVGYSLRGEQPSAGLFHSAGIQRGAEVIRYIKPVGPACGHDRRGQFA